MKTYTIEERQKVAFADRALDYFKANPTKYSFTLGEVNEGQLFAVRWHFDKNKPANVYSVLVLMLDAGLVVEYGDNAPFDVVQDREHDRGDPHSRLAFDSI